MSTATARPQLIQLECPNCRAPVSQFDPGAQTIVCETCGSYIEVGAGEPEVIGKSSRLRHLDVPIKVGDFATIDGTQYFVLGRVDYTGWTPGESESWQWTEWLLGEKKGRLLWLAYDEKGFTLYRKVRNTPAFDPHTVHRLPLDDSRRALVHERYPARITAAQGELTWRPKIDSDLFVLDAAGNGKRYSVQQTGQELEVYEGDPVDEMQLAEQFDDDTWRKRVKRRQETASLLMEIGVLCFVFAFIGLIAAFWFGGGAEPIANETISLSQSNPTTIVPINIEDAAGRPAEVSSNLRGSLRANTAFDVDVWVTAPNETRTFVFSQFFWHETGRDEDGPWTDTQYSTSSQFVPMEDGPHQFEFTLTDPVGVTDATLDITIYRNSAVIAWLIIYMGVVGTIGIIAFVVASNMKKKN